jgi:hypothetical protein
MSLNEGQKNEENMRNYDEYIPTANDDGILSLNHSGIPSSADWQMPWISQKRVEAICSQHRLFGGELVPAALQIQKFFENYLAKSMKNGEVFQLENVLFQRKMEPDDWPESTLTIENHGSMQQLKLICQNHQLQFSSCFWSRENANKEERLQGHRFGLSDNFNKLYTQTLIE